MPSERVCWRASGAEEHSSASPNASTSTGQQDVQLAVVVDIELAAAGRMEERDEAAATVSRRIVNRVARLEADPAADRRRRLGGDEHAAAPLAHRAQPPAADAAERLRSGREEASPCAATRGHLPSIESSTGLTSCQKLPSSPTSRAPRVRASSRTASSRTQSARNTGSGPDGRPPWRRGVLRIMCASSCQLRRKQQRVGRGNPSCTGSAALSALRRAWSSGRWQPDRPSATGHPLALADPRETNRFAVVAPRSPEE